MIACTPEVGLIFNGTRKKQRYGGLSPRHVRLLRNSIQKITAESMIAVFIDTSAQRPWQLIRDYLPKVHSGSPEATAALFAWTFLILDCEHSVITKATEAGLALPNQESLSSPIRARARSRCPNPTADDETLLLFSSPNAQAGHPS